MAILVTGAAGYIGSVITEELIGQGHSVLALDNLSKGHPEAVHPQAAFIRADLGDRAALDAVFEKNQIAAVIHLAAESIVGDSMINPGVCFQENVSKGLNLLEAMTRHNVKRIIFSSTASVYGIPKNAPISEIHLLNPINPYGESKLMFEKMLGWYHHAHSLRYVSLRYFNAAGATGLYGEDHDPETHLIPLILRAASEQKGVSVFGTDYNTPDGSCIRDYIHVSDISRAHILALDSLDTTGCATYNVGNGAGYSVLEVIHAAESVTGTIIPVSYGQRRPGDPPVLVANNSLIHKCLGWQPRYPGIKDIIRSAWQWHQAHPNGYGKIS